MPISYEIKKTEIQNIEIVQKLDVPFKDLSTIQNSEIRRFRMRPLIVTPSFDFMINGHLDFHKGSTEDPMIGSV